MRRRTLVDLLRRNLRRDPGDAPPLCVEADVAAQDMAWMPAGVAPGRPPGRRDATRPGGRPTLRPMSADLYPRRWTRTPVRHQPLLPPRRRWTGGGRAARLAFWWRSLDARR